MNLKNEISRFSQQIAVLLGQLEAQNELRAANDALRLKDDILKTQDKDMEKMMADILADSAGSQEYAQDITRLVGGLGEREAWCEDQERPSARTRKELRMKLRESDVAV